MAELILAEQTIDGFSYMETYGAYVELRDGETIPLKVGNTYTVIWDGTKYECVGQDTNDLDEGSVTVGNLASFDLSGNGEPFAVVGGTEGVVYMSFEEGESHTVAIYDGVLEEDSGGTTDGYLLKDAELAFELETNSETVYYNNEVAPAITVGNTYTVIWDGDYCECVAKEWTADSMTFIVLGNLNIEDSTAEDTGEPFLYMYMFLDGNSVANFKTLETDASHVISLYDGVFSGYLFENVELSYEEGYGLWMQQLDGTIGLNDSTTYTVTINGTDYVRKAYSHTMDGQTNVVLGNSKSLGGEDTGEPFLMACVPIDSDSSIVSVTWLGETPLESCTVSLYEGVKSDDSGGTDEPTTPTMANIVLYDRNGNAVTYEGIKTVSFNTDDGQIATFTLSAISSN